MTNIRVLLVDDEPLILRTLKRIIDWDKFNMAVVGEVYNGKQALEWLSNHQVDIVITDVAMPLMGGIELIKKINGLYPDICTAVVSGYDDFKKVKDAFVSGAIDYVLKSDIDTNNMNNFLKKLKQKILDHQDRDIDIKEYANAYDVAIEEREIRCVIAKSTEYEQPQIEYLKNIVVIDDYKPIYRRGEILYLIPEKDSLFIIRRLVKHIKGKQVIVGISDTGTINESNRLYEEAYKAMELRFYDNDKQVFLYEKRMGKTDYKNLESIMLNIKRSFRSDQYSVIVNEVNNLGLLFKKESVCIKKINNVVKNIMQDIFFIHKEITGQKSNLINEINDKNIHRDSWKALKKWIEMVVKQLLVEREALLNDSSLKNIELYLKTHYHKNITISQVSMQFSISESYLSHKFKEIYGISFKAYLNQIRMVQAKKLLRQTELKQFQICRQIGFSSSEHFSRIFKKYVGVSPKAYRNQKKPL